MSTSDSKKITLKSSDSETFEVEECMALNSQTIKHMTEDNFTGDGIPLPNVTAKILAKVIEYCTKHVDTPKPESYSSTTTSVDEELNNWDANFVKDLKGDQDTLFDLILAANYLDIKGLLDLTCKTVADMMNGQTLEAIREIFHIVNDYTKEEEGEIRRENQWAFE